MRKWEKVIENLCWIFSVNWILFTIIVATGIYTCSQLILIQLGTVLSQHSYLSIVCSIKTINEITNTKALIYSNICASNKNKNKKKKKYTQTYPSSISGFSELKHSEPMETRWAVRISKISGITTSTTLKYGRYV
jgi:hypothetical protein